MPRQTEIPTPLATRTVFTIAAAAAGKGGAAAAETKGLRILEGLSATGTAAPAHPTREPGGVPLHRKADAVQCGAAAPN